MVLNPQTSPFPPISQMEESWEQNIRASLDLLAPGEGIRSGLKLGIPLSSGQPTTGLTPTLTDGYLVKGDQVMGPYGSKLVSAIAASQTLKNAFFGLKGYGYGDASNAAPYIGDVLIGQITSNADSIVTIGQQYNYGAGRFGIRGLFAVSNLTDGADTDFFNWTIPATGLDHVRITYAQAKVIAAATAGNDASDDFVLKVQPDDATAVDLVTLTHTNLGAANATVRFAAADGDAVSFEDVTTLSFQYNQTDGSTALAGGLVEVNAVIELF